MCFLGPQEEVMYKLRAKQKLLQSNCRLITEQREFQTTEIDAGKEWTSIVKFQVFAAASIQIFVSCEVAPCSLAEVNRLQCICINVIRQKLVRRAKTFNVLIIACSIINY